MAVVEGTFEAVTLAHWPRLGLERAPADARPIRWPLGTRLANAAARTAEFVGGFATRRMGAGECDEHADAREHIAERRRFILNQLEFVRRSERNAHWEARLLASDLENSLSTLGFEYHFQRDKRRVQKTVHVETYQVTPDEFRFKVDARPGKLPLGVDVATMTDEKIVKTLEAALSCQIAVHLSQAGLWYRVFRKSGVFGVPSYVRFSEMTAKLTANDGPLVIPLGLGLGRRLVKLNFAKESDCHMLIAGTTGSGKTSGLHTIITLLAMRPPDVVHMVMVDLKRVELKRYASLPHLVQPIVKEKLDMLNAVEYVSSEVDRRYALMDEMSHVNHIRDYNQRKEHAKRLPYLFLIIDEANTVMLDPTIKQSYKDGIEAAIGHIGQLGRAAGVHMIFATQRVHRDVITPLIQSVLPAHLGYRCANNSDSVLIVNNADCNFKRAVPPGRAILARGMNVELQVAYATPNDVDAVLTQVAAGAQVDAHPVWDVTVQEMVQHALDTRNSKIPKAQPGDVGTISLDELYEAFKARGPDKQWIRWRLEPFYRHGKTFVLGEQEYTLRHVAESKPLVIVNLSLKADLARQPAKSDPLVVLRCWIADQCELDPNLWEPAGNLLACYQLYAKANGVATVAPAVWGDTLREHGCEKEQAKVDGVTMSGWSGIRIKPSVIGNQSAVQPQPNESAAGQSESTGDPITDYQREEA